MRFHFEAIPLTGMTDVMSVQAIGMSSDNRFVIEAETEDEAIEKFLDLIEKRVYAGQIRPATEDEAKEFEEEQEEAKRCHEAVAKIIEAMRAEAVGK